MLNKQQKSKLLFIEESVIDEMINFKASSSDAEAIRWVKSKMKSSSDIKSDAWDRAIDAVRESFSEQTCEDMDNWHDEINELKQICINET